MIINEKMKKKKEKLGEFGEIKIKILYYIKWKTIKERKIIH